MFREGTDRDRPIFLPSPWQRLCDQCDVALSFCDQDSCTSNQLISLKLDVMTGLCTKSEELINVWR